MARNRQMVTSTAALPDWINDAQQVYSSTQCNQSFATTLMQNPATDPQCIANMLFGQMNQNYAQQNAANMLNAAYQQQAQANVAEYERRRMIEQAQADAKKSAAQRDYEQLLKLREYEVLEKERAARKAAEILGSPVHHTVVYGTGGTGGTTTRPVSTTPPPADSKPVMPGITPHLKRYEKPVLDVPSEPLYDNPSEWKPKIY